MILFFKLENPYFWIWANTSEFWMYIY